MRFGLPLRPHPKPPTVTAPLDDEPMPRSRWGWFWGVCLLLIAALLVARLDWGRRIAAKTYPAAHAALQHTRRLGALPPESDAAVPDVDNAVFYLRRASAAMDPQFDHKASVEDFDTFPLSRQTIAAIGPIVASNHAALDNIRRARSCTAIEWRLPTLRRDPIRLSHARDWVDQRRLVQLLNLAAKYGDGTGHDDEAVEYLRDILFLSNAMRQQRSLMSQIIAGGMGACVAADLRSPGCILRVGKEPGGATPAQFRSLIASLANSPPRRMAWRRAVCAEVNAIAQDVLDPPPGWSIRYVLADDFSGFRAIRPPAWINAGIEWLARPCEIDESASMLPSMLLVLDSMEDQNFRLASARFPKQNLLLQTETGIFGADRLLEQFPHGSWFNSVEFAYQQETQLRLTAVAAAIHLYQAEHKGQLPADVRELVPAYIASIPIDPMSPTGRPLQYVSSAPRPFIYSVSKDGIDNVAAGWSPGTWIAPGQEWRLPDTVWFVAPPSPASAATRPVTTWPTTLPTSD